MKLNLKLPTHIIIGFAIISSFVNFNTYAENANQLINEVCQLMSNESGLPDWQKGKDKCLSAHKKTFSDKDIVKYFPEYLTYKRNIQKLQDDFVANRNTETLKFSKSASAKFLSSKSNEFDKNLKSELIGETTMSQEDLEKVARQVRDDIAKDAKKLSSEAKQ